MSPTTTYRLQLSSSFTFDDAAARVPYLARLGVTHLYLSPVLQAAPGSTHGYDVVDHERVSVELGGREGLERLAAAAHAAGLGIVLDVVPNHMSAPTPAWRNRALWSVLSLGADSPFSHWFDVDWSAGEGAVLMPVLGARLGDVLASGELRLVTETVPVAGDGTRTQTTQHVLRYYDHAFPVRPGTEHLPLAELVERQHYRLAYWRVGDEELNYRRFFDVGSLVAIRVEDEDVFEATHRLVLDLIADGTVDGLRIDHPDGLADPAGYLARLADLTDGAWVVVEKILAGDEEVPADWATAGTTGYDLAWRLQQLFVDSGGRSALDATMTGLSGDLPGALTDIVDAAKREIIAGPLYAEVHRLTDLAASICHDDPRLRDHTWRGLHRCVVELLVAFDRYRAYVTPGTEPRRESVEVVEHAAHIARERLDPVHAETLDVVVDLVLGRETGSAGRRRQARRDEFVIRFQQVSGAVMAKGVEDTAFYRWTELTSLTEVGGEPDRFGVGPHEWHAFAERQAARSPHALTAMSTHDTKRGEDTRAAIGVLSERSTQWAALVERLRVLTGPYRGALVDGRTENLLWQTLVGTWDEGPIAVERLVDYLLKAVRETKEHTSWVAPNAPYERAVVDLARTVLRDEAAVSVVRAWHADTAELLRAAVLGTTLIQLTAPGVADVYQGSEAYSPTLVDPDNRRPVDFEALASTLDRMDAGASPRGLSEAKLRVTALAVRLRRDAPEAFVGPGAGYVPLATSSPCAVAFARTVGGHARVVSVATRLAGTLARFGGWRDHTMTLPEGSWRDLVGGGTYRGGSVPLREVLADAPVALLVPEEDA